MTYPSEHLQYGEGGQHGGRPQPRTGPQRREGGRLQVQRRHPRDPPDAPRLCPRGAGLDAGAAGRAPLRSDGGRRRQSPLRHRRGRPWPHGPGTVFILDLVNACIFPGLLNNDSQVG